MDEEKKHIDGNSGTSRLMDGQELLIFLKKSGIDVNAVIVNVLKGTNTKTTPDILIQRIFKDENSQLVRYFDLPKKLVVGLKSNSAESVQVLTANFQKFVLDILVDNKRPKPSQKITAQPASETESSEIDSISWDINALASRWSENYDELSDLIPNFLHLISESYEDPRVGSADEYYDETSQDDGEYDEDSRENAGRGDHDNWEDGEYQYIPHRIVQTLVSIIDILNAKSIATCIKIRNSKNKRNKVQYVHDLKTIISLFDRVQKLKWSLFFYYPDGPSSISVKLKEGINATNIYIEEFSELVMHESWWKRLRRRIGGEQSDKETKNPL